SFFGLRERVKPLVSVVVAAATHRVASHSQELEDEPDHDENDTDCDQDWDRGYQPDDEQDDAQNDHAPPPFGANFMMLMRSEPNRASDRTVVDSRHIRPGDSS